MGGYSNGYNEPVFGGDAGGWAGLGNGAATLVHNPERGHGSLPDSASLVP